jgi:hypothetical protein
VNSNSGFLGFVQPSQPSSQYYSSSPSSNATHAPLSSPYGHQSTTYMPSPRAYSMSNGGLNGNRAQALPQQGRLLCVSRRKDIANESKAVSSSRKAHSTKSFSQSVTSKSVMVSASLSVCWGSHQHS